MATIDPIKVEGLQQFVRSIKKMDSDLPKMLRVALNDVVGIVVNEARPRIPRRTGRTAATLKGQSTQSKARVRAGGNRARGFGWIDFGGKRRGRGGGIATRPFKKQGRYVWAAFGEKREQVTAALNDALVEVAREAGLEVTRNG